MGTPVQPPTQDFISQLIYGLHSKVPLSQAPDVTTPGYVNPSPPVNTTLLPPGPAKKRASFTACAACQSKHCACDEQRPCSRCVRLRIVCTEGVPRKGKTKKKPQKNEATAPPLPTTSTTTTTTTTTKAGPDPYVALERELLAGKYPNNYPVSFAAPSTPLQPPPLPPSTPLQPPTTPYQQPPSTPYQQPPSTPYQHPPSTPLPPCTSPFHDHNNNDVNINIPPSTPFESTAFPSPSQLNAAMTFEFVNASLSPLPLGTGDVYDLDSAPDYGIVNSEYVASLGPISSPSPSFSQSTPVQQQPTPSQPTPSPPIEELSSSSNSSSSSTDGYNPFLQPTDSLPRTFAEHLYSQQPSLAALSLAQSSLHPLTSSSIPTDPVPSTPSHPAPPTPRSSTTTWTSTSSPSPPLPSSSPSPSSSSSPFSNSSSSSNTSSSPFSPHFPPSTPSSSSSSSSSDSPPSGGNATSSGVVPPSESSNNAVVLGLQHELQELRRELAATRHRERLAFPLHQRVCPKDIAMTLWSLNDGNIVDFSSGFLKLFNYTASAAEKLCFYDISPHSTRAQRRHLLAYFLRERPEVNGVVTYKSVLHSSGKLLDVLCTSTVYYFEDSAMIQLVFFKP